MSFFARNIDNKGRRARAITAILLLAGAALTAFYNVWVGLALLVSGAFVLFEALRGWCVMRACGIKTRM